MTRPWSAERIVTETEAAALIEAQFPELAPVSVHLLGEGFDNMVYRVNDRYVFRFPRRTVAVSLLERECALLPEIVGDGLPLAVPVPLFIGRPTDDYAWPFAGYPFLDGFAALGITREQRVRSAEPLAEFMAKLHRFPVERAFRLGAPGDLIGRLEPDGRLAQLTVNRDKAIALGLWSDPHPIDAIVERMRRYEKPAHPPALVHGDFHFRNVLVDEEGVLSAVIDWGDLHVGHAAADLAFVYSFLPPEGRSRFFAVYGETDEATLAYARVRAAHTTMFLLLYGHDLGDERLVGAAQATLRLVLEDDG
ncbi:phosphotransferase [Paenibacillus flagellatus]|uniref:Phosphotransferase n=1 Tax=Paenibacillus flagellatus TaxID=2211139 RepID=A0A2V5K6U4_9BACL|nr:phosphotransferase [Paenibacillus flagellatus]PYI54552.1 phosphotransferase [Paenibacillus flagellatus]